MFADDLAIQITGDLDKRFSLNIVELEKRAKVAMETLKGFAEDNILPVNIKKTKAMLIHSVVAPRKPIVEYNKQTIEHVKKFKYLGVTITTKLGWGNYISDRVKKKRRVYHGMKSVFLKIPVSQLKLRQQIFTAFVMPHFIWLFSTW